MAATRLPNRVAQPNVAGQQPNSGANPQPITSGGRVVRPPIILQRGPGQALEQFNDPSLPDSVNRQLNALQAAVRDALQQIKSSPFANGNMLVGVSFTNGVAKVLAHDLGRAWQGWWLTSNRLPGAGTMTAYIQPNADAPAANAMVRTPSVLDTTQITLVPQGTFVSDVWVF